MEFKSKVVVVTGAGQGLGETFAKAFAGEGAHVALIGRTPDKLQRVRQEIETAGYEALDVVCNISDPEQVREQFARITDELGPVDILVNNAAFHQSNLIIDTPEKIWQQQVNTNLNGTFYCAKAVLPAMIERRYGKIINISSAAAKVYFPGFAAYAASKAGILNFTQNLSEEVKQYDINVNAVLIGMTNTENTRRRFGHDQAIAIELADMIQEEDVKAVILFLASDMAKSIMGAGIDVFYKHA